MTPSPDREEPGMPGTSTDQAPTVNVDISKDRLRASLRYPGKEEPVAPKDAIIEALRAADLVVDQEVQKRVDQFVANLSANDRPTNGSFVVAESTPAVDGQDEEFVWDEIFEKRSTEWQGDAAVNYYTLNSIVTVTAGTTVGRTIPAVPAKRGVDVTGKAIEPARQAATLELDSTVQRCEADQTQIVANIGGRVILTKGNLGIVEVLIVDGDVDFKIGNLDSHIDIHVDGIIEDRFEVKSAGSITVCKAIQAAHVEARQDVMVRGGILGHGTGRIVAGGEIVAKFGAEARLTAGRDIKITGALMNCRTHSDAVVLVESGSVIGGTLYARSGLRVSVLGSDAHVETRILVGPHPSALGKIADSDASVQPEGESITHTPESITRTRELIARIREAVQPLMADLERLTDAQKKQVTGLLFKADQAERDADAAEEGKQLLLTDPETKREAGVVIFNTAFPNTTVSIGHRSVTLHKPLKGPVAIELRKVKNVTEIVAVNQLTGSIRILPSNQLTLDELLSAVEEPDDDADDGDDASGDSP